MSEIRARFSLVHPGFSLDVDLALLGRGITTFLGHSGAGKTTLLRCIAGLERTANGYLAVNGDVWQDGGHWVPTHRRALGYVFQEARLFPHLPVKANLNFGRRRVAQREHRIALDQVVALLDIGHLLDRLPDRLSGGEKSRVAIARALATSPCLLLMDEPLAALDHARKQEVLPYLERLRKDLAIPMLYVTHALPEVARLADHLVVMAGGRAVAQGPLTETLARLDLPIQLGEDTGVVLDTVVVERDAAWHLAQVEFPGGRLWVRDTGHPLGQGVRVRILARDVSLARERLTDTSILNTLPATVIALGTDSHPALALVRIQVGASPLLARLTQRSVAALGLAPGLAIWAQIKSVAIVD